VPAEKGNLGKLLPPRTRRSRGCSRCDLRAVCIQLGAEAHGFLGRNAVTDA
jgi:hypothetical protein